MMRPRVCESLVAERPYWNLDKPDGLRDGGYRIDPPDKMMSLVAERPYWNLDKPDGVRHGGYRIDPPDKMILYRPLVPTLSKGPEVAPTQMMRRRVCEPLVEVAQTQLVLDAQGF